MALKRHRLARQRRSVGYSQEQLAERLGVERSTVGRWERAETDPLPYVRPRLAGELRISLEELNVLLEEVQSVEPQRDERLAHVLGNPAGVDLVTAARLRQRVQALTEEYDRVPSALLLAAAGQCHGQVAYLRQNAPSGRVLRELFETEAESATLMGQLVWDASQRRDHATTLAYFDAAVLAARQVGDRFAEAHAQLRRSYVALYGLRDPREGLALAKSAARSARGVSPALVGVALMHVGEAHAMCKETSRCEKALGAALSQFDRSGDADPAAGFFTPEDHGRMAGSSYLFLGRPERAAGTLAALRRDGKKTSAIVLGNLSIAHIRTRQLDAALDSLHEAINVVETTRGGGGMNLVFTAGRELALWRGEPAVTEINDRLLALMTAA